MKSKWTRELEKSIVTNSQFLLWGNIYDIYPLKQDKYPPSILNLKDFLKEVLIQNHYDVILYFEPVFGLTILDGKKDDIQNILKEIPDILLEEQIFTNKPLELSPSKLADVLEAIDTQNKISVATIINYNSRINEEYISPVQFNEFYFKTFRILQNSKPKLHGDFLKYNIICFLFDKENDIPAWYTTDNQKIKNIPIPKPDFISRKFVIENLFNRVVGYKEAKEDKKELYKSIFIDQTNGLFLYEIKSIILLAQKEQIEYTKILEAINRYKLGIIENEWAKVPIEKLLNAEKILAENVIGQEESVIKTSNILKRVYFNLSGSQFSKYSSKPKGVMFFAGPTGVGKTELAKSITRLIFGNENNYIRFDMSEFSAEHTTQRLLGAPPGYIGYETGGELINAIKKNPFSVILFDEIEKAHPRIIDIFLQILDDSRITSAKGETVYFNEAIIIFTSNLGVYNNGNNSSNINIEMDYNTISKKMISSINSYFKDSLKRPEILNRIGENIVVFDFIRKESAEKIFDKMLNNILNRLEDTHNIKLYIKDDIKNIIKDKSLEDLSMGGRGIGNQLENIFINPLSRALFEVNAQNGDAVTVTDFTQEKNQWILKLTK